MGVKIRVWTTVLALVLLSTFIVVPSTQAAKDECDNCGNTCWRDYQQGWDDCYGSPAGCARTVVCG